MKKDPRFEELFGARREPLRPFLLRSPRRPSPRTQTRTPRPRSTMPPTSFPLHADSDAPTPFDETLSARGVTGGDIDTPQSPTDHVHETGSETLTDGPVRKGRPQSKGSSDTHAFGTETATYFRGAPLQESLVGLSARSLPLGPGAHGQRETRSRPTPHPFLWPRTSPSAFGARLALLDGSRGCGCGLQTGGLPLVVGPSWTPPPLLVDQTLSGTGT